MVTPINTADYQRCEMCPNLENGIFSGLEASELQRLSDQKVTNFFKKGQTLFVQGALPVGLHCIASGSVKLTKLGARGDETILRIAQATDVLGYRGVITGENYAMTATAMEDSVICLFDREAIFEALRKQPVVGIRLVEQVGRDLESAEERVTSMSQRNAFERTAELLLLLKSSHGAKNSDDHWEIGLRLKREELASMAGISMVTLIRILSEMKSDGIIEEANKTLSIVDEDQLIRLANLS